METKEAFSKALRNLLQDRQITQLEFSKAIGVAPSTVNEWLSGRKMPRMDRIDKIADFFSVSRSALIGDPAGDAELAGYLEELKTRPEMRMLFSLTSKASKEDVEKAVKLIEVALGK